MKKAKKVVSLAMVLALVTGVFAGCSNGSSSSTGSSSSSGSSSTSSSPSGGAGQYKIGYNILVSSDYALSTLANNVKQTVQGFGGTVLIIDDEGTTDKVAGDIQNMISAGCKGIAAWAPTDQLFSTVQKICDSAKIPYVLVDKVPSDPATIAAMKADPYCAGAVGPANDVYGKQIADYAIQQGYKTCLISAGNANDPTDTPRIKAFRTAFEAAGGKVLDELHTNDTAHAQNQIESSLVAHPNPDFIYGSGSNFGNAAVNALSGKGFKTVVLTSGLDGTALKNLNTPNGSMKFINGDDWISGMLASVVLQNYLDGHPLKDSSGNKVWYTDLQPFQVTPAQYSLFQKVFINQFPYTAAEIKQFDTANNPSFNYDAFMKLAEGYSLNDRFLARYKDGTVTADELKAAGVEVPAQSAQ